MKNILVTGGAGFIGGNFVHHWLEHRPGGRLVVLDVLTYAGCRASLADLDERPEFRFVKGDIIDAALVHSLLAEENIDTVVHFAAESHVDRSIVDPDAFLQTNIMGTHSLLQACRTAWKDRKPGEIRFHHVSTDEVYGSLGPNDPAFAETTPYAPNSPYAASKAASDHLVRSYVHTYGLPATISNCSNNYGPYHFPEKLIPLMLVNTLFGRKLPVYGDGKNVRDWLHVEDHCRGIAAVLEHGKPGETYNIGGNAEKANIDVVHLLCRLVDEAFAADPTLAKRFPEAPAGQGKGSTSLISFVADRPGHDRRYAINAEKARSELGFAPQHSFESGLRATVAWYLANEPWWRAIMDGGYRDWIETNYSKR
jgi:dTDP-glucose 4,6-dehydratase